MEIGRWFMFESLGPAVPGSPVMEDRKADLLPYLSQEAQRSRISFPGGQPELGVCWAAGGAGELWEPSPYTSGHGRAGRRRLERAHFCVQCYIARSMCDGGAGGQRPDHFKPGLPDAIKGPGVVADKPSSSCGGALSLGNMVRNQTRVFVHSLRR